MNDYTIEVFDLASPWSALSALEAYLRDGGRCEPRTRADWEGLAMTCSNRAIACMDPHRSILEGLAWAKLGIIIRESMCSVMPPEQRDGTSANIFRLKASMIRFLGDFPGDDICDLTKVISWYFSRPKWEAVRDYVDSNQKDERERTLLFSPEIRSDFQVLSDLQQSRRWKPTPFQKAMLARIQSAMETMLATLSGGTAGGEQQA